MEKELNSEVCKPVRVYDMQGDQIAEYKSLKEMFEQHMIKQEGGSGNESHKGKHGKDAGKTDRNGKE